MLQETAFLQYLLPPQISTLSPASLPPCEENWKLDFVHGPLGCTQVQRAKEEGGNPVRKAAFRCDHCTARFFLIWFDLSWFQMESLLFEKLLKKGLSALLKLTVFPFVSSPLILFQLRTDLEFGIKERYVTRNPKDEWNVRFKYLTLLVLYFMSSTGHPVVVWETAD